MTDSEKLIIINSQKRIEKMRNGEKIKCTKCDKGFVSAVGDAKTTKVFKCDNCGISIVLTIPLKDFN